MTMFDTLRSMFRTTDAPAPSSSPDATHTAIAALLVETARVDENYSDKEKSLINNTLSVLFDLAPEDASNLRSTGEEMQAEANDLHGFTKIAKELPNEEKIRLIEALWAIVLSDGTKDQYEDALIRRICGLIYVNDRASGEARQRIEEKLKALNLK